MKACVYGIQVLDPWAVQESVGKNRVGVKDHAGGSLVDVLEEVNESPVCKRFTARDVDLPAAEGGEGVDDAKEFIDTLVDGTDLSVRVFPRPSRIDHRLVVTEKAIQVANIDDCDAEFSAPFVEDAEVLSFTFQVGLKNHDWVPPFGIIRMIWGSTSRQPASLFG